MGHAASATASRPPRHQRRVKNYLLDRRFQLKYSGYLVLIAVILGGSLSFVLWRTSQQLLGQSQQGVRQGEKIVALGKEVVTESRKVSEVVQMNIVEDPVYSDNPALLDAFKRDAEAQEARLNEQHARLIAQSQALHRQSAEQTSFQRRLLITLSIVLVLFVFCVGFAGIVVTHKVAGPIFKMKGLLDDVGEGRLRTAGRLRKGDELVDFFHTFETMVNKLRSRQEQQLGELELAISALQGKATREDLQPLYDLKQRMRAALDA